LLSINAAGGITFTVSGGGVPVTIKSLNPVNDGKWHHVIAECDRNSKKLVLYIDGKKNREFPGIGKSVSLLNSSDLYAGGSPEGNFFHGTYEFLRISLGTLRDAKTTIDELYAWQFNGPFLRDFTGNKTKEKRDAGALEKQDNS